MSKPISGIFSAALTLFVVPPGYSAETPVPDPATKAMDLITETETAPRQIVVINPPKGWLLAYPHTPYGTIVVRESYRQGDQEDISTGSLSDGELCKYDGPLKLSPGTGKLDANAHRNVRLIDTGVHNRYISDARPMGSRVIGGEYTVDSAHTATTRRGEVYACQFWMVGRPEGLWDFHVCLASGETSITPELLTALETTRWVDTPPTFSYSKAEDSNYPY